MNEIDIRTAFATSTSKSKVCEQLNIHKNGIGFKKITDMIDTYSIDISHFRNTNNMLKYERIEKLCPVCGEKFITQLNSPKEKTTCSYACSNTYFRTGIDHPNWKNSAYRSTCFYYHEHKCVICGEHRIIDVHHFDNDKNNNNPENLIPMCPTHHMYIHSRYSELVEPQVIEYQNNYVNNECDV